MQSTYDSLQKVSRLEQVTSSTYVITERRSDGNQNKRKCSIKNCDGTGHINGVDNFHLSKRTCPNNPNLISKLR